MAERGRWEGDEAMWPIVGRQSELDFLAEHLRADAPGVVVVGELGVGKSRLADATGERLRADGWDTSVHLATEARQAVPFAVFSSLLAADREGVDPLHRLLDASDRLTGAGGPVLLQVDDAQWLDDESRAFLQHVAETTAVKLLLTVRASDPGATPTLAFTRGLRLQRVELQPLGRTDVAHLLSVVRPTLTAPQVGRLWEVTEGNPLYLHELVTRALERGELVSSAAGPLAEVVGDRFAGLDPTEQALLELVATGGFVPLALLHERADGACVAGLERRGLIVVEESGRRLVVRLAHPVYGEVLTGRMGVASRRLRRAELLEHVGRWEARRESDLVQIAVWGVEQGDVVDPALLLSVAYRLVRLSPEARTGELPLPVNGQLGVVAARLAKASLDGGGGFAAAYAWLRIEADLDIASARSAEALRLMDELARTDEERVLAAGASAMFLLRTNAQTPEEAVEALDRLAARSTGAPRRCVEALLAFTLAQSGHWQQAIDIGLAVRADPATTPHDRLSAGGAVMAGLVARGRSVEALALNDVAFGELGAESDQWDLSLLVVIRIATLRVCGRLDEAQALAEPAFSMAKAAGSAAGISLLGVLLAENHVARGRLEDGMAVAREVVDAESGRGVGGLPSELSHARAILAQAHACRGDGPAARAELVLSRDVVYLHATYGVWANRTEPWVMVAEGRRRSAVERLRELCGQDPDNRYGTMSYLYDLVRLGEHGLGVEMQALVDDGVDGAYWAAATAHAVAFDAGAGAGLDAASAALDGMGMTLMGAEAAAQASDAHAAAGDRAAAAASRRVSRELAGRCQGAKTPALEETAGVHAQLTARELEVARLAGAGMADQAIADEVHLSVRTVETYLHRVYFKLGLAGRAELVSHPEL